MVLITAAAGLYLGDLRSGLSPFHVESLIVLAGIALVTGGSSVLNQALERRSDARMKRTASRPMVTGRISLPHGLLIGFATIAAGTIILAYQTQPLTATLSLLTATSYVAIYTPLKRITSLNTFLGAFPGALPPAHRLDRRPRPHRVARRSPLRRALRMAVPPFHGHRLALPRRLPPRRHPPRRHPAAYRVGRPLHRRPGPLLRRPHDPHRALDQLPRHHRPTLHPHCRAALARLPSGTPSSSRPSSATRKARTAPPPATSSKPASSTSRSCSPQ